jgi:septal ring factor EnvC (AmiA/AmiB activator)
MATLRGVGSWLVTGALCAGAAGCVTQWQYDSIARANLQMQDKLAASQAERVKARTQVALLRQELVQAKQGQQDVDEKLQAMKAERDTLQARLDVQARRPARPAQTQPAQTQPVK